MTDMLTVLAGGVSHNPDHSPPFLKFTDYNTRKDDYDKFLHNRGLELHPLVPVSNP